MGEDQRSSRTRFLVEGVVIVVSILLAFGIEAGWQRLQEADRTDQALSNLEAALVESIMLVDSAASRIAPSRELLNDFLTADPETLAELPPETAAEILRSIHRPAGVVRLHGEEIISLLDDDVLRGLDDLVFRSATADWRAEWQVVLDRHESLYQLQEDALRALARHPQTRPSVRFQPDVEEVSSNALRAAREDEELMMLAVVKRQHWDTLTFLYRELQERARALVHAIQMELAR